MAILRREEVPNFQYALRIRHVFLSSVGFWKLFHSKAVYGESESYLRTISVDVAYMLRVSREAFNTGSFSLDRGTGNSLKY